MGTDLVHTFTNWVSYNRGVVIAGLLAAALAIPACIEFKGQSPVTGKPETAAVLAGQEDAEKARLDAELKKAEKLRTVAANALRAEIERRTQEINADYEAAVVDLEAEVQRMQIGFDTAHEQISAKQESLKWWIDSANTVVAAIIPGLAQPLSLVTSLLLGGAILDNRRKDKKIRTAHGPPTTAA